MIKRAATLFMLAFVAVAFSGLAFASVASAADNGGKQQQTQQMMQQYRQDAQQLQQIHQKTIKNNPQLAQQQQAFEKQVRSAVKKQGYNIDKGQKRMQAAAQKLQSGDTSKDDRQAAMKSFQSERQKMVKARDAALQQPDIQKAGKKLESDTITAMNKQNPKTRDLLAEMKNLRGKLQASMPSPSSGSGK